MGERSVQPNGVGNRGCTGGKEEKKSTQDEGDRGGSYSPKSGQPPRPAPCPIGPGRLNRRRSSRQRLYEISEFNFASIAVASLESRMAPQSRDMFQMIRPNAYQS
jgi:hypothetical protein